MLKSPFIHELQIIMTALLSNRNDKAKVFCLVFLSLATQKKQKTNNNKKNNLNL